MTLRHFSNLLLLLCALLCGAPALRAQAAGNLDPGFDPNVSFHGTASINFVPSVSVIAVQPDGKAIIGGNFDTVGTTACNGIARLKADGTVDTTFVSGLGAGSFVSRVALLPGGKILVSSSITTTQSNQTINRFNRLNADGSVDSTFTPPSNYVRAMSVQADGTVLLAAGFPADATTLYWSSRIVRLKTDGSMDSTFNVVLSVGGGITDYEPLWNPVGGMAVQPDGKILVKGEFTSLLGQPRNRIARLNADGSLDSSFDPGSVLTGGPSMSIASVAPLDSGKILVIGSFSGGTREPAPKIVRLNADGTLDGTFLSAPDAGFFYFTLLAVQVDGKILIGGTFDTVYGEARIKIARLNADGSLESTATFDAGSGIGLDYPAYNVDGFGNRVPPFTSPDNTKPLAISLQPDGKILVGGDFTTVNGQLRNRMARLLNDPASQTLTVVDANQVQWQRSGSGPGVAQASLQLSRNGGASWTTLGNGTRVSGGWQFAGLSLPASGIVRTLAFPSGGGGSILEQSQSFSGLPVFTVTTSASPAANGTITGDGNRAAGSTVNLVATPADGCDFTGWTENGIAVSSSASLSFTATADRTLVANFTRRSYTIATSSSNVGGGATSGGGTFSHGTWVTLYAAPAPGFNFVNWSENGNPVSTNAVLGFSAAGARTLVANFTPQTFTITTASYPSVQGALGGGGTFNYGDRVTLVAVPATGYKFANWSVNGTIVSLGSTFIFPATANRTLVANFTPVIYTFNAGATYNAATNVLTGGSATLSVTSGSLYLYGGGILTLNGNPFLTVNGQPVPVTYTVGTSVFPAASGSVVGSGWVYPGASVTVLATPAAGRSFANWTENGTVVSTSASYTFTPGANRTLVANFTAGNNANLASLLSEEARLTPTFDTSITSYSARVPSGTSTFTLTPILEQDGASIQINGVNATPGALLSSVALQMGSNTITTTVTAPDGVTTRTYTTTVIRGSFAKDFNGDGTPDIIFQNTAGQIVAWFTDASGRPIYSSYLSSSGLGDWRVVATTDVNGDGFLDLVFQNGAGQIYVWFLDGTGDLVNFATGSGIKGAAFLYGGSVPGWRLAGMADVNGDGFADLVFQNAATGQVYAWFLDGTGASINFSTGSGIKGTGYLYGGSLAGWRLAAIGDVNSDGIPDLVFQHNSTGQLQAWLLNGTGASINFGTRSGIKSTGWLYGGSLAGWQLESIADANGDGIPDLLFQNSGTGQVITWFLDGTGASINFGTGSGIKSTGWLYAGSLPGWQLR